ncbi:hypothetical protein MJD09_09435 [bacterium]|nr:hypothetical protein [bacterium]
MLPIVLIPPAANAQSYRTATIAGPAAAPQSSLIMLIAVGDLARMRSGFGEIPSRKEDADVGVRNRKLGSQ